MNEQGYLRHPALRGDVIVFVCDDDLWSVSAQGGTARRLTAGLGEPATPCLSPDGKWALAIDLSPPPQLVMLPTGPGEARRLPRHAVVSYQGAGWTPDGQAGRPDAVPALTVTRLTRIPEPRDPYE